MGLFFRMILVVVLLSSQVLASISWRGPVLKANAQPQLLQLAARQPGQAVDVIVQVNGNGLNDLQMQVGRLGGRVTRQLKLINAFSASMPASSAVELARRPGIHWVSLDAPVISTNCNSCIDTSGLVSAYDQAIRAPEVWNSPALLQGQGIGVAVIDSGVATNSDLMEGRKTRLIANYSAIDPADILAADTNGHGTHVSSIIGGNGRSSNGGYIGVAPKVNIINVKVNNNEGSAQTADIIEGLQWVLNNQSKFNIRVVNLSLNSSMSESYHVNPLDAAVEMLWLNGIVVVVSAGNHSGKDIFPPANDPFVITVGATDDRGTSTLQDDEMAGFSASGITEDGFTKPDLVAPGKNIVARIVKRNLTIVSQHPENVLSDGKYFRMSGTSMAAPMVAGAAALLLQDEPDLTPDQVKFRLMATANQAWPGYNPQRSGAGYVDVAAAVDGQTTESANAGLLPSQTLIAVVNSSLTVADPSTTQNAVVTDSTSNECVSWNSVSWNSVSWNSVSWNSVSWNSVSWNTDYWGE